jgi:hypothetical protein
MSRNEKKNRAGVKNSCHPSPGTFACAESSNTSTDDVECQNAMSRLFEYASDGRRDFSPAMGAVMACVHSEFVD